MKAVSSFLAHDREDMTDFERALFIKDLKKYADEYFETDGDISLEVTRSDGGFIVCAVFSARRIKTVKRPL